MLWVWMCETQLENWVEFLHGFWDVPFLYLSLFRISFSSPGGGGCSGVCPPVLQNWKMVCFLLETLVTSCCIMTVTCSHVKTIKMCDLPHVCPFSNFDILWKFLVYFLGLLGSSFLVFFLPEIIAAIRGMVNVLGAYFTMPEEKLHMYFMYNR